MSLVCPSCDVVPSAGAAPGSACAACGSTLIRAGDRNPSPGTNEPLLLDLPPIGDLQVIDLAERTGAPAIADTPRPPPAETATTAQLHPDIVNLAPSDEKLELEGGWAAEKAAKVAGKTAPSRLVVRAMAEDRAARRHNAGLWFALVLVLAVVGAGVFLYIKASEKPSDVPATVQPPSKPKPTQRPGAGSAPPTAPTPERTPPPPATNEPLVNVVPDRGIAIRIIGAHGTPITIDGAAAGKSPISLKRRASTREMVIGANGKQWKIVPDRDQTIDISE